MLETCPSCSSNEDNAERTKISESEGHGASCCPELAATGQSSHSWELFTCAEPLGLKADRDIYIDLAVLKLEAVLTQHPHDSSSSFNPDGDSCCPAALPREDGATSKFNCLQSSGQVQPVYMSL